MGAVCLSILMGCLVQSWWVKILFFLIVSCFVTFSFCLPETCSFLKETEGKWMGERVGEGRLKGMEGGKTVVGMYCIIGKNVFSIKKTKKKS